MNATGPIRLRRADLVLVAGFLILITLPLVCYCTGWGGAWDAKLERRPPARAPRWGQDSLREFPGLWIAHYRDRFTFRQSLVSANAWIMLKVFRSSPRDSVVLGRDHWLFYNGSHQMDDHLGLRPLEPELVARWRHYWPHQQARLRDAGIAYLFLLVPDKQTVYPDQLPPLLAAHPGVAPADQVMQGAGDAADAVLDLRPVMQNARRLERVYYPLGTHWNHAGAHVAYLVLLERLGSMGINRDPLPRDAFTASTAPGESICHLLGIPDSAWPPSTATYLSLPSPQAKPDPAAAARLEALLNLPFWVTTNSNATGRVLIIHDSFLEDFARQVLPEHFARTVWFSLGARMTPAHLARLLELEKPDLILEERVERALRTPPAW